MMMERDTRQKLLAAAKKEFLAGGYKGASLRRICAEAGVTTGALYFFFDDKASLFDEIIRKPLAEFEKLVGKSVAMELENGDSYIQTEEELIRFLTANRDECVLLLEKADGSPYSGFREKWQNKLEEIFGVFFEKALGRPADPDIVRLITAMRMHGYLELLRGNHPEKKAGKLVKEMAVYADAGFSALISAMKQEA